MCPPCVLPLALPVSRGREGRGSSHHCARGTYIQSPHTYTTNPTNNTVAQHLFSLVYDTIINQGVTMYTTESDRLVTTINGIDIYVRPDCRYYSRKGMAISDMFRELEDAIADAEAGA